MLTVCVHGMPLDELAGAHYKGVRLDLHHVPAARRLCQDFLMPLHQTKSYLTPIHTTPVHLKNELKHYENTHLLIYISKSKRRLNHYIYLSVTEPPPHLDVHSVQPEPVEFSF